MFDLRNATPGARVMIPTIGEMSVGDLIGRLRVSDSDGHANMVRVLVKAPDAIQQTLGVEQIDLIHAVLGISGEAGELLDAIKKHAIYNKPLDRENVIEELGDLEFYLEQIRQRLGITRQETIEANMAKLAVRYAGYQYSDTAAQTRADKAA